MEIGSLWEAFPVIAGWGQPKWGRREDGAGVLTAEEIGAMLRVLGWWEIDRHDNAVGERKTLHPELPLIFETHGVVQAMIPLLLFTASSRGQFDSQFVL